MHPIVSRQFFEANSKLFKQEHDVDLRGLERITLPEHLEDDNIAKRYRTNKYRLTLSDPAFTHLMQYIERIDANHRKLLQPIIESQLDLRHVDRAMADRFAQRLADARRFLQ